MATREMILANPQSGPQEVGVTEEVKKFTDDLIADWRFFKT